jgi:hypothetical protein
MLDGFIVMGGVRMPDGPASEKARFCEPAQNVTLQAVRLPFDFISGDAKLHQPQ